MSIFPGSSKRAKFNFSKTHLLIYIIQFNLLIHLQVNQYSFTLWFSPLEKMFLLLTSARFTSDVSAFLFLVFTSSNFPPVWRERVSGFILEFVFFSYDCSVCLLVFFSDRIVSLENKVYSCGHLFTRPMILNFGRRGENMRITWKGKGEGFDLWIAAGKKKRKWTLSWNIISALLFLASHMERKTKLFTSFLNYART